MVQGSGLKTKKTNLRDSIDTIEELIAGKKDYDLKDSSDNFRLKFNRELTKK